MKRTGRISERFAALRERGETALMPFISAGDPDLDTTEALVCAMAESGADVIELGVPFSDPIAEGPTIQRSSERGIASGASLRRTLLLVKKLRAQIDIPIVLMGYANPIYTMGEMRFVKAAAEVGVDGLIVVDLPPEEGAELYHACRDLSLDAILLAGPTTSRARLEMLMRETRGFLYYVSLTGVTGTRASVAKGVEQEVRLAQSLGDAPVCVGFGISTPAHAKEVAAYADGVIVGSAVVDRIEAAASPSAAVSTVAEFVASLKEPLGSRLSR